MNKKKEDSKIVKSKKSQLEREIARLENVLITIQTSRLKLDEKNAKLDELTVERETEIKVLQEKIIEKDKEIEESEKIYLDLRANVDDIIESAMGM